MPRHPCEDLWVLADEFVLESVIGFIKREGIDRDDVHQRKRCYASSGTPGVWKMGQGIFVEKLRSAPQPLDAANASKFKRVRSIADYFNPQPLLPVADVIPACSSGLPSGAAPPAES